MTPNQLELLLLTSQLELVNAAVAARVIVLKEAGRRVPQEQP